MLSRRLDKLSLTYIKRTVALQQSFLHMKIQELFYCHCLSEVYFYSFESEKRFGACFIRGNVYKIKDESRAALAISFPYRQAAVIKGD